MTIMQMLLSGGTGRATLSYTYSTNTTNASLNVTSISGYNAGKSDITITVNSGIYVYSTSTGTPGLTLTGGTTGDTITLVNNGYIMGMGGQGANSGGFTTQNGFAGGVAISLGFNTTINNTNASAYIGGGGGGGGGGQTTGGESVSLGAMGGGGAGGGTGGTGTPNYPGGAGGGPGSEGLRGQGPSAGTRQGGYGGGAGGGGTSSTGSSVAPAGGGGGRIFPGTGGAGIPNGGNGGSANSAGSAAGDTGSGGGGGGWGASGGNGGGPYVGGAGGKAVALNGRTVTWVSGNTTRVYGAVS